MPFDESVSVAVFMFGIVFLVLFGLYFCIRLSSFVLEKAGSVRDTSPSAPESLPASRRNDVSDDSDEICLNNVDEKAAAMLMAIVAHESGIPLPELRFQSIRRMPSGENVEQ